MSWRWVDADAATRTVRVAAVTLDRTFDDQASAEAWLTAFYDDLAEAGVSSVSLFEEDRLVYGPMSLLA